MHLSGVNKCLRYEGIFEYNNEYVFSFVEFDKDSNVRTGHVVAATQSAVVPQHYETYKYAYTFDADHVITSITPRQDVMITRCPGEYGSPDTSGVRPSNSLWTPALTPDQPLNPYKWHLLDDLIVENVGEVTYMGIYEYTANKHLYQLFCDRSLKNGIAKLAPRTNREFVVPSRFPIPTANLFHVDLFINNQGEVYEPKNRYDHPIILKPILGPHIPDPLKDLKIPRGYYLTKERTKNTVRPVDDQLGLFPLDKVYIAHINKCVYYVGVYIVGLKKSFTGGHWDPYVFLFVELVEKDSWKLLNYHLLLYKDHEKDTKYFRRRNYPWMDEEYEYLGIYDLSEEKMLPHPFPKVTLRRCPGEVGAPDTTDDRLRSERFVPVITPATGPLPRVQQGLIDAYGGKMIIPEGVFIRKFDPVYVVYVVAVAFLETNYLKVPMTYMGMYEDTTTKRIHHMFLPDPKKWDGLLSPEVKKRDQTYWLPMASLQINAELGREWYGDYFFIRRTT